MHSMEYQAAAQHCLTHWPGESAHVIQTAEDVCENRFLFDMPWDLERTAEPVAFTDKIDWNYRLNGDWEFLYQLNRHRFLLFWGRRTT